MFDTQSTYIISKIQQAFAKVTSYCNSRSILFDRCWQVEVSQAEWTATKTPSHLSDNELTGLALMFKEQDEVSLADFAANAGISMSTLKPFVRRCLTEDRLREAKMFMQLQECPSTSVSCPAMTKTERTIAD